MRNKMFDEPIDLVKEIRFKYYKEANYNMHKYTKQLRRTTRQIINKFKFLFKSSEI
jgi:hypothetical protein